LLIEKAIRNNQTMLKKIVEGNLTKDPYVIASSLIILGVILFIAERYASLKKEMSNITVKDAILVGLSQCLALIPGSSRSGTTITAGLFLGMTREAAARFSFLLSIPAIAASGLLSFYQEVQFLHSDQLITLLTATIVSAVSGYAAIAFLINYLKKKSTMLFIIYRIALGIALIIMALANII
jgi:undecaprenyl-diphosphatase